MWRERSLVSQLLRGSAWAGSARALAAVQGLVLNVVLARLLTPEGFGLYFIAVSLVAVAATVGTLGLDQAAVRLVSESLVGQEPRRLKATARTALRLSAAAGGAVVLVFAVLKRVLLEDLLGAAALVPLWLALALWIFAAVQQRVVAEIFRGFQDYRLATLFGGLRNAGMLSSLGLLAGLGVLYMLAATSLGAMVWLTAGVTASIYLAAAIALRVVRRGRAASGSTPGGPPEALEKARPGFILPIAGPLLMVALLAAVRTETDVWLLAIFLSASEVAVYSAAFRLAALIFTPLLMITSALAPLLPAADSMGGMRRLESMVRVASTAAVLVALPLVGLLLAVPGPAMRLLFGSYYEAGAELLMVLVVGQIVNVMAGPNLLILSLRGEEKATMMGMLATVIYVATAGWILTRTWGAIGMAAASASGLLVQNAIMAFLLRRRLGIWSHLFLSPRAAWRAARELRT